jgi:catechol 2,3-dioxygenase-like lactoylglutathione lyase family enzyme
MLSHVGIEVDDMERSRAFYEAALAPLGIEVVMDFGQAVGFGKQTELGPNPFFWLNSRGRPATSGAHVCFGARTTDLVDAFHAAALSAGGTDNGAPGPRPQYHPGYYGSFVLDPDGNNVEAVNHGAPPAS